MVEGLVAAKPTEGLPMFIQALAPLPPIKEVTGGGGAGQTGAAGEAQCAKDAAAYVDMTSPRDLAWRLRLLAGACKVAGSSDNGPSALCAAPTKRALVGLFEATLR